jgi:hypothetical protein
MDLFSDSIDSMELDVIKQKITDVYNKLLTEYFKKQVPGASEEDIASFIEENMVEFEGSSEESEEVDEIMSMLDEMLDDGEDLEPVDGSGKAPDYTGTQLGVKSKEGSTAPTGTYRGLKLGGMMTPTDSQVKAPSGKKPEDPMGGINTKNIDDVMVQYAPLVEKLKEELASLKQRKRIGIKEFRLG